MNLSNSENLTWAPGEINDLWDNINRSSTDPVSYWITVASFIFALLGSISNFMSLMVLTRLSTQLSTFVYLTSLSLSDMIACVSITMTHTLDFCAQTRLETSIVRFLRYVEIVFGAFAAASRVLSYWISTAVTMDRWMLICYPIYGKTFCTVNRARNVSRVLFFIAFIYSLPLLFEYKIIVMPSIHQIIQHDAEVSFDGELPKNSMLVTKTYTDLAQRIVYRWAYLFFNMIFVYAIPTVAILIFNIQLIRALHRLKSRTKRLRQKTLASTSKYSVTLMVIIMVLILLICRSPTIVLWILWSFELTIKTFFDSSSSSLVRRFHNIANLIAIINAATNFLPFCVFGQLFRAGCLNLYCCRKRIHEPYLQYSRGKDDRHRLKPLSNDQPASVTNVHGEMVPPTSFVDLSTPREPTSEFLNEPIHI